MMDIRQKRSVLAILWCCVIVTLFLFSGCQEKQSPKKKVKAKTSVQKEARVPEPNQVIEEIDDTIAPDETRISEFRYNPHGRRDPFRSLVVTAQAKGTIPDLPPLQQVEVAEMRLIGIIWGSLGYSAMVQTPDGKGYTVRIGTSIGLHNGIVKRIFNQGLTVQEEFTEIFGTTKTREIVLELHPQEERGK
jgi:type IV pilus assembly protein PilP